MLLFGNFFFFDELNIFGFLLFGLEFFDSALSVDKFHLSCEEGMTLRTDINFNGFFYGSGGKFTTASTGDDGVIVPAGMDVCFHINLINFLWGVTGEYCSRFCGFFLGFW